MGPALARAFAHACIPAACCFCLLPARAALLLLLPPPPLLLLLICKLRTQCTSHTCARHPRLKKHNWGVSHREIRAQFFCLLGRAAWPSPAPLCIRSGGTLHTAASLDITSLWELTKFQNKRFFGSAKIGPSSLSPGVLIRPAPCSSGPVVGRSSRIFFQKKVLEDVEKLLKRFTS